MGIQSKVLRAMISGEIYNIDSNIPKAINVRIVSTSRIALDKAVEEGKFREDLLFRLNIVSTKELLPAPLGPKRNKL